MHDRKLIYWLITALCLCGVTTNALAADLFEINYTIDDVDVDGGGDDDGDGFSFRFTRALEGRDVKVGAPIAIGSYTRGALEETLADIENFYVGGGIRVPVGADNNDIALEGAVTFDHTVFGGAADNGLGVLFGARAGVSPRLALDGHLRLAFQENSDLQELRFGVAIGLRGGNDLLIHYRNRDYDVDGGGDFEITSIMLGLGMPL